MTFDSLPQNEERFRQAAKPYLKAFSLPVEGENLKLNGELFKPDRGGYFYAIEHPKVRIVLHFTAGNTRSDMQSLTTANRHVSTAFVLGRDGSIYNLFPSKYWSGHLGAGIGNAVGTGNPQDKATVGIEISNYGYLVPHDGNLETIYSRVYNEETKRNNPVDIYCSLEDTDAYVVLPQPFRGQKYFAKFSEEQLDSLIILLRFLTKRYNIPREFLPENKRYISTPDVLTFRGIVSHVNYRNSGKWDIGQAFDWDTVIAGVKAPEYIPVNLPKSIIKGVDSEAEIDDFFPVQKGLTIEEETETTDNEGYDPFNYE